MPPHSRDAEVVADGGNTGLTHAADQGLQVFELLLLARAVQQHVVPVRGVEVLYGRQRQALGLDGFAQVQQFVRRPQTGALAGLPPIARGIGARDALRIVPVVHQVRHNVRGAGLPREAVVLRPQHVAVQA